MNAITAPAPAPARCDGIFARIAGALRAAFAEARRRRAMRRQVRILARLDAGTLRDIGLTRQEIGSVAAELHGVSAPTRRRTAASSR